MAELATLRAELARVTAERDAAVGALDFAEAGRRMAEQQAANAIADIEAERQRVAELERAESVIVQAHDEQRRLCEKYRKRSRNQRRELRDQERRRILAARFVLDAGRWKAEALRRERDAARARVRELLKVARAAVAHSRKVDLSYGGVTGEALEAALDALPPNALEEPSDVLGLTPTEATAQQSEPYHPDPEIDAEVRTDKAMGRAADETAGILEGWHRGWKEPSDG